MSLLDDNEIKVLDATKRVLPKWIAIGDDDKKKVSYPALGQTILDKTPLIITPGLLSGAVYNGHYWERINGNNELNIRLASLINHELDQYAVYSLKNLNETRTWITSKAFTPHEVFNDSKPHLIPFMNGTYNLLTDELQTPNPKNHLMGGFNYKLDTSGKEPTTILTMIKYMVGDADTFLIEYIGYMFYRSYEPFNKFVIMQGQPGNGKSTLNNNVITPLLGGRNISHLSLEDLTNGIQFNTADLLGKYANIYMDLKNMFIPNPDIMKNLTGGDDVNARFKGGNEFTLANFATFLFASNELPILRDDGGIFSRAVILPTIAPVVRDNPAEQRKRMELFPDDQIKKELPAFAHYAMRTFKRALDAGRLSITPEMEQATTEWRYSDPLSQFLNEETTKLDDHTAGVSVSYFRDHMNDWFYENGLTPPSPQTLVKELEKRGFPRRKSRKGPDNNDRLLWRFMGLNTAD